MSDNAEENQEPVPENITQDPQPEPQPIESDVPRETISSFNRLFFIHIYYIL